MIRGGLAVAAVAALVAVGVAFSPCRPDVADVSAPRAHGTVQNAPDWTVAPCALWIDNATPTLPAYTVPDACITADGYLSVLVVDSRGDLQILDTGDSVRDGQR